MIEGLKTAETSVSEFGSNLAETDNKLDTSQPIDFSNDSDYATEKDGNKETEGQQEEHTVSEDGKLDTSQPIDFSDTCLKYDDNGKVFTDEKGELLPNTEYTVRGYKYKTDDHGRIVSASGDLCWKDHEGRLDMPDSINDIGKGYERPTDNRGHLIADEFNGAGGKENLVPMDSYVNQHGDYRKLEKEFEQKLRNKQEVYVEIDVNYTGDSRRPDSFTVSYDTGGEHYEKTFLNEDTRGETNYDK